jgi:hypothetical protein
MTEADDARQGAALSTNGRVTERQIEIDQKAKELAEFRDAGVLTDAEVEEQMAMFRWHLP